MEKVWSDAQNQDGIRPTSVKVQLKADGTASGDPITLDASNSWKYTWENLPKYAGSTTAIEYTVDEVKEGVITGTDGPGTYKYEVTQNEETGAFTVTNTHTPVKTTINVTKEWDDQNDREGIRPTSVQVQLKANGENSGEPVTLDEDNSWAYTWQDQYVYAGGSEIKYTVEEPDQPDNYTAKAEISKDDQSGTWTAKVTNSHTPGTVNVSVKKVWDDSSDKDKIRPSSIKVQLTKDGNPEGEPVTLNESNNWSYEWTDLLKEYAHVAIQYAVDEVEVPGEYTKTVTNSGNEYTITNKHTPTEPAKLDPPVQKKVENKKGTAPKDSVFTFSMTPKTEGAPMPDNKQARTDASGTLYMDQKGPGSYEFGWMTFTRDDVGKTYEYEVKEVAQNDKRYKYDKEIYTLTVAVTMENNKVVIDVTYTDASEKEVDQMVFTNVFTEAPKTGDNTPWLAWLTALVLSGGTLATDTLLRRKKNRSERRG